MESKLLLPHRFKKIGWCLLIPATILGVILLFYDYEILNIQAKVFAIASQDFDGTNYFVFVKSNITITAVGLIFIIGAMLVGFSKEEMEDEFIANIRLSSLLWAVWVNYVLLFFAFLFIYGFFLFNVTVYNMFTILIIFIVRFNFILYKSNKTVLDEKQN